MRQARNSKRRDRQCGTAGEVLGAGELARAGLPALWRSFSGVRDGRLISRRSYAFRRASWSWKQDPRRNGFRRTRVAGLEPEHGQEVEVGRLSKAMLQHQLLVQAIEGFFGDARVSGVRLCGLRRPCAVATEVSDAAVPIRARACVLSMPLPTRNRVRATRGVSGAHLRPGDIRSWTDSPAMGSRRAESLTPIAAARLWEAQRSAATVMRYRAALPPSRGGRWRGMPR